MKFLPLIPLISGTPAFAKSDSTTLCTTIGEFAEESQYYRQTGGSLSTAVAALEKRGNRDLQLDILFDAFEEPIWADSATQYAAIIQFRNFWELECFKYFRDNPAN